MTPEIEQFLIDYPDIKDVLDKANYENLGYIETDTEKVLILYGAHFGHIKIEKWEIRKAK